MSKGTTRSTTLAELGRLMRAERFDDVLSLLRREEARRALLPTEQVTKGRAIQLAEGRPGLPLAAAKQAFLQALELDPENVPALLELAWYCNAVEDDAQEALPLFERALELSRDHLTEATRGRSECLGELGTSTT